MTEIVNTDVLVIGGGIAGVSAAAALAETRQVVVVEQEFLPGFHATGRSAAFLAVSYGNEVVQAATAVSESFFRQPPQEFTDVPLLRPRDAIFIGREDQTPHLDELARVHERLEHLSHVELKEEVPFLKDGYASYGLKDRLGGDIDVDALLQGYVKKVNASGGSIVCGARVISITRDDQHWLIETSEKNFRAKTVINAAGAWADQIAGLAGLGALGITPKRRTAVLIDPPPDVIVDDLPFVVDVDEEFYFKPDAGLILVSPADATPSEPCDAQAEELDIAIAVDRFIRATGIEVRRIGSSWAGLRSFAADDTFVVGFDPRADSFFWLVGQGGYGIQTAPCLAEVARSLITGEALSTDFEPFSGSLDRLSPDRFLVN